MPATTRSGTSTLLICRSDSEASTDSVADAVLLALLASAVVAEMVLVLGRVRAGSPLIQLGRTTRVIDCASLRLMLPMLQLKLGAAGVIWAPGRMLQLDPVLVDEIDTTVKPASPTGSVKLSVTVTPAEVDGPLFENDSV